MGNAGQIFLSVRILRLRKAISRGLEFTRGIMLVLDGRHRRMVGGCTTRLLTSFFEERIQGAVQELS